MESKLRYSNNVLGYFYAVDDYLGLKDISRVNNISIATVKRVVIELIEKRLIEETPIGRDIKFKITEEGKKYVKENNIIVPSKDEADYISYSSRYIQDLEDIKKDVEDIRNETLQKYDEISEKNEYSKTKFAEKIEVVNQKIQELDTKLGEVNEYIVQLKTRLDSFYGRIGEILALIITAISIIVFNIKVMETTKIDFSNGRQAFINIMAIDSPLIILMIICIILFHFIVDKKAKIKSHLAFIFIIIMILGLFVFFSK
ncbi:hypothetical protein NNC19_10925 [Clostridium sp. SHJSY1]|uniref:hypothetical protein n=1 Tax=Clostridium sp. SHJSY1 TaxID=2942483 RepID=UPI0028770980|nr:hypothetical protein [Clostridium sp. SHJSY1]MDS0526194.1 hypothetical protein [Clostridium sp. SHJSY1]